jgi:hypothetical protein
MNSVWYDGTLYFTNGSGVNWERNTIGLKKGNKNLSLGMWSNQARKKFISRSTYLAENSHYDPFTFILTYRGGQIPSPADSKKQINNFNRFLKRQGLKSFSYVAELGSKSGFLHYHYLVDSPRIEARNLSEAWGRIRGDKARNAVRGVQALQDIKSLSIYNSKGSKAIAYAAKGSQLSKKGGTLPQGMKVWQTSHDLVGKEKISTNEFVPELLNVISGKNAQKRIIETKENSFELLEYKLTRSEVNLLTDLIELNKTQKEIQKNMRAEVLAKSKKARELIRAQQCLNLVV